MHELHYIETTLRHEGIPACVCVCVWVVVYMCNMCHMCFHAVFRSETPRAEALRVRVAWRFADLLSADSHALHYPTKKQLHTSPECLSFQFLADACVAVG